MFNLKFKTMKKLFFLVSFLAVLGISSAWAQNSGTAYAPGVGDKFTYSVVDHGVGYTYAWTLTTNANGTGSTLIGAGATDVANVSAGAVNTNSVQLLWNNPATDGTVYYLHVTESDGSCMNRKVIAIQPKNNFKLDIANVDESGVPLAGALLTNNPICAPDIPATMTWTEVDPISSLAEATNFKYDYGTRVFYYKITASGLNFATKTWTPSITVAQAEGTHSTVTIATQIGGVFGASWVTPSTIVVNETTTTPTIPAGAGNNVIWVRVTVANGFETPALANENTTANSFTISFDVNNSQDQSGNKPTVLANSTVVQSQKARPATTISVAE